MDDPETACGEDCLNKLLLIEWYEQIIRFFLICLLQSCLQNTFDLLLQIVAKPLSCVSVLIEAVILNMRYPILKSNIVIFYCRPLAICTQHVISMSVIASLSILSSTQA